MSTPQSAPDRSHLSLVLGGARSGKSRFAESLVRAAPPPHVYIATAEAWDQEMRDRIAAHRADRGQGWTTVEAPRDLMAALDGADVSGASIMVDCLTLWVTNLMCDPDAGQTSVRTALSALAEWRPQSARQVVFVSNEVGLGIVPDNAMARAFRDHVGRLHQDLARASDRVVLMVAGLPLAVKGVLPSLDPEDSDLGGRP